MNLLFALYSILIGLALGSFINVCIYRLPLGKSILRPPSSCPHCDRKIRFYDNIPLISYLILLGRCRYCGHPISRRYPAVEALTGLISLALFTRYGLNYQYAAMLLFTGALVTVSFIDLEHQIIPDRISLPGIAAGLTNAVIMGHISLVDSLIGIFAGGGILFLIGKAYQLITGREGMGGGDVKLLAMIGAWLGWKSLAFVALFASLTGAVLGSAFLFLSGKGYRVRIPFGPFLCLGALFYLFFGRQFVNWYLHLLM